MSTLDRFLATWRVLRQHASWVEPTPTTSATQAALLVLSGAEDRVEQVPAALQELRESTGFFSNVRGSVGQSLVAVALAQGQTPRVMATREAALRQRFRDHGLPWAPGVWTTATAAWMSLLPAEQLERALPRMKAIMERWDQDHPWLTGADDLHAAALHAMDHEEVEAIGLATEERYQALDGFGLNWNGRQRAAQLTALRPEISAPELMSRMSAIKEAFRAKGRSTWFRSAEPLALLAMVDGDPVVLGEELDSTLSALEGELQWVADPMRCLIAASIVTGEHRPRGHDPLEGSLLAVVVAAVQAQHALTAVASG